MSSLLAPCLLLPLLAQSVPEPSPHVAWSALGAAADAELVRAVRAIAPGLVLRFEAMAPERLLGGLIGTEHDPPIAVLGYSVALLDRVAARGALEAVAVLETACADAGEPERRYQALWFDPVVLAFAAPDALEGFDPGTPPTFLPRSLEDLAAAAFDNAILLESPELWNCGAALLAAFAAKGGGADGADRWIEGLDANAIAPYPRSAESLFASLVRRDSDVAAVTTLGEWRRRRAAGLRNAGMRVPSGLPVFVALGVAAAAGRAELAEPLFEALGDAGVLVRTSAAAELIPAGAVPDAALPAWMAEHRASFVLEAPRLPSELPLAQSVLHRFRGELSGRLEERHAAFTEIYDSIGIVLMVAILIWVLRRKDRDPAADPVD